MAADAAGSISASLLPEYDQEMTVTRKHLERVPDDKLGWGPHEKSMTMGKLASHLAESISWGPMMLTADSMDFDSPEMQEYTPPNYESRAKILEAFDESVVKTREVLASTSDTMFTTAVNYRFTFACVTCRFRRRTVHLRTNPICSRYTRKWAVVWTAHFAIRLVQLVATQPPLSPTLLLSPPLRHTLCIRRSGCSCRKHHS